MSGVDNRIVTMKFDNRQFEQGARTSMSTLQRLKASMNFGTLASGSIRAIGSIGTALGRIGGRTPFAPLVTAAQKGFGLIGGLVDKLGIKNPFSSATQGASDLQRAAQVAGGPGGMGVLEGGVTAVSGKFVALTTIAVTALSNITNRAINAGTSFAKSFTIAPIMDGLHEYQTTLQSIQTVQANTDAPLKEVEESLLKLNAYSDTTIYNFGEMARNVGTFTAAGVDLKTSVASIQGIANIAALSGSTSQQAATAMYQLSQAISSGKVGLMDWNSVVNAGMGGKKLQNALAQTAIAMGEIDAKAVKMVGPMKKLEINGGSFRESIMAKPGQESWLSSDILVNTLASLDGRFSVAYQKAQLTEKGVRKFTDAQIKSNMEEARANLEKKNGVKYSDEQYAALLKMASASTSAAQDVKTLGQVFDIAKETIGSGWAASFKNIFGGLDQSKKLFTGMSKGLNEIINQNALARNKLLNGWSDLKLGGRSTFIAALTSAWHSFYDVIKAVSAGFRDVFPRKTVSDLQGMTISFALLMQKLKPSEETLGKIRTIAGGLASVFHIMWQVLKGVGEGFKTMFSAVGGGNGDFLSFVAGIGEAITRFDRFLEKSGIVTAFFQSLGHILSVPLAILKGFGGIIAGIFNGFDSGDADKVGNAVGAIGDRLSGLQAVGARIRRFFGTLGDFFGNIGERIGSALMGVGDMIATAFSSENFDTTLGVINTTLLGGIILLIKNFFSKGLSIDLTGGLFDGIKETLGSATGAFEAMQMRLKADVLLRIAGAIAVMAAALLVLSMIDPAALSKALAAMTTGFGVLIGALAVLMKVMGPAGLVQLYVATTAVSKMALSILLLAFALRIMSSINFGDMVRGLVGLALALKIINKAMLPMAAGSKGMGKAAGSILVLGLALNVLAIALKIMASMSWEEMAKGLLTTAGALGVIAVAMRLMPKDMFLQAAGILVISVALNALGVALKIMGSMDMDTIGRSLTALAGSLVIIGAAMNLMPSTMLLTAAGLLVAANALVILGGALKIMGSMNPDEITNGLIALGGALLILGAGLNMIGLTGTAGAIGLLIAANALAIFVPVIATLGAIPWDNLIKALTALSALFIILGVAGYLLAPVVPVILGLGVALLLMGAGLALAGAGALAAATAFGIIVAMGTAAAQLMAQWLDNIISAIPAAMGAFGKGVVKFATAIAEGAPRIANAFGRILSNILNQVIKNAPKVAKAFLALLNAALRVIVGATPRIVAAGFRLIISFMRAISANIGQIIKIAADIVVKFINGIGKALPRIIQAGVRFIINFVNGLATAIDNNAAEMGEAGARLGGAIVRGMIRGVSAAAGDLADQAVSAARGAVNAVGDFLGVGGPSKLFRDKIGVNIPGGMREGVKAGTPGLVKDIGVLGRTAITTMDKVMAGVNETMVTDPNFNPTITPVLDLGALTQEANKMSSILATAPIMAGVSYQTAADISAMTQTSSETDDGPEEPGSNGGRGDISLTIENHSPKPIDSVESYRAGKTLISLAKETLG